MRRAKNNIPCGGGIKTTGSFLWPSALALVQAFSNGGGHVVVGRLKPRHATKHTVLVQGFARVRTEFGSALKREGEVMQERGGCYGGTKATGSFLWPSAPARASLFKCFDWSAKPTRLTPHEHVKTYLPQTGKVIFDYLLVGTLQVYFARSWHPPYFICTKLMQILVMLLERPHKKQLLEGSPWNVSCRMLASRLRFTCHTRKK